MSAFSPPPVTVILTRKPFVLLLSVRSNCQLDYAGMAYGAEGNRCLTSDTWATRMGAVTVPFHLPVSLEKCKKPDEMAYSCSMMSTFLDGLSFMDCRWLQ